MAERIQRLMKEREVEARFALGHGVLAVRRHRHDPNVPPFIQLGRSIRYEENAVEEFLRKHTKISGQTEVRLKRKSRLRSR
jgi:hypothetical protein